MIKESNTPDDGLTSFSNQTEDRRKDDYIFGKSEVQSSLISTAFERDRQLWTFIANGHTHFKEQKLNLIGSLCHHQWLCWLSVDAFFDRFVDGFFDLQLMTVLMALLHTFL